MVIFEHFETENKEWIGTLIVPNDYQQFWVHFEWFLSFFSNFGCKIASVTVQAKSMQKWYFFVSNPIFKKFSYGILVPHPFLCKKNWVKMVLK